MPFPQRYHKAKESKNLVTVIMFIGFLPSGKPSTFVRLLTGSRVLNAPAELKAKLPKCSYFTKTQKLAQRMTAQEYVDCVKEAALHFAGGSAKQPPLKRYIERMALVHDRSACHPHGDINIERPEAKLTTILAPPRSPDLMPLDYAVFGTVKAELGRLERRDWTWADRATTFVKLLEDFNPTNAIESFPKRLQNCLKNGGGHVVFKKKE